MIHKSRTATWESEVKVDEVKVEDTVIEEANAEEPGHIEESVIIEGPSW